MSSSHSVNGVNNQIYSLILRMPLLSVVAPVTPQSVQQLWRQRKHCVTT